MSTLPHEHGTGPGQIGEGTNIDTSPIPGTTDGMLFAHGEALTAAAINRGPYALSENIDHIWSRMKYDTHPLAIGATISRTSTGDAGYQFSGGISVFCGKPGETNPENVFQVVDSYGGPIFVQGERVVVVGVLDGPGGVSLLGTNFHDDPYLAFNVTIPSGVDYQIVYGERTDLDELPVDAHLDIQASNKSEVQTFSSLGEAIDNTRPGEFFILNQDTDGEFADWHWRINLPGGNVIAAASNGKYLAVLGNNDIWVIDTKDGSIHANVHQTMPIYVNGGIAIDQRYVYVATGAGVDKYDHDLNLINTVSITGSEGKVATNGKYYVAAILDSGSGNLFIYILDCDTDATIDNQTYTSVDQLINVSISWSLAGVYYIDGSNDVLVFCSLVPGAGTRFGTYTATVSPVGTKIWVMSGAILWRYNTRLGGRRRTDQDGNISMSDNIIYENNLLIGDIVPSPHCTVWSVSLGYSSFTHTRYLNINAVGMMNYSHIPIEYFVRETYTTTTDITDWIWDVSAFYVWYNDSGASVTYLDKLVVGMSSGLWRRRDEKEPGVDCTNMMALPAIASGLR